MHRKVVDEVRKDELRRLKKELLEEECKQLKGTMWLIRNAFEDLTEEEKKTLDGLFERSPILFTVYIFSAVLSGIFELHQAGSGRND